MTPWRDRLRTDPSVHRSGVARRRAWLEASVLAAGYFIVLLATAGDLGYARDEGFYFDAAEVYARWFDLLFREPGLALSRDAVDEHWRVNHEHPALVKSLFALGHRVLHERLGLIAEPGLAHRVVGMAFGATALAVIYRWAFAVAGRAAAFVAALSYAGMPRVFFHAHLACFDVPVLALWLVVTASYVWALAAPGWRRSVVVGVLYGLLLNTKHNAWILPPVLGAHWLAVGWMRGSFRQALARCELLPPRPLLAMLVAGPLVLFATWPWLWFDTIARLREWAVFHVQHVYYNMEFLGETYWKPPMPRLYAPVMTLATVPLITLMLAAWGVFEGLRRVLLARRDSSSRRPRSERSRARITPDLVPEAVLLWLLCILGSYGPWLSTTTPIFGGTKHWMTAYPYLCLFAGVGFARLRDRLGVLVECLGSWRRVATPLLAVSVTAGPLLMTAHAHPFALSAYTPVVGGAPGAANLGLNRTYWGYTTAALIDTLNREAPPGARVYVHDTALPSFRMLQRDGRLRTDLRPTLSIAGSDLALYHYEQHMGRVEYQIWVDYGTTVPLGFGLHDGVPVVWLYERPRERR